MGVFEQFPYTNFHELNADWILRDIKSIMSEIESLESWKVEHEAQYEELKLLYDQIISGNFPESITEAFSTWMRENALDLVGDLVKMVFFNITDDGYFIAYIPDSWSDIRFGTSGLDDFPVGVEYGHLTLIY